MASKTRPIEALAAPTPINGAVPKGYLPASRPRYRWVSCPFTDTGDDPDHEAQPGEPFRAEIRTNLTWGEIDTLNAGGTFLELFVLMAPLVRAWNALGTDAATGEVVTLPPPALAGPDTFHAIDADLTAWLWGELRTAHLGGDDRGKG